MADVELVQLSNLDLLALLVAAEAGGEPLAGQVAVACTVTERLARRRAHYGATLRQVMLFPGQYSTFNTDHWRSFIGSIPRLRPLAELALGDLLRSPVSGATHYCHKDLEPKPTWTHPEYATYLGQIQAHIFYRER